MKFNYEIELIDAFCESLETYHIEYKRELSPGYPSSRACIDIVIRVKNNLIGIEAKIKNIEGTYRQALGNRIMTPFNYVLYPTNPSKTKIIEMKRNGIGLIIYNSKLEIFQLKCFAKRSHYTSERRYIKLKQNWNRNRIGRSYNDSELPPNYNNNKIKMYSEKWSKIEIKDAKINQRNSRISRQYKQLDQFM